MGRRRSDEPIDWEAIEREYRLGDRSIRQLATQFKVQASAISRRATKDGWVQDKSAEVRALSEAQLLKSNTSKATPRKATDKATPDRNDIEAAALARTNLILGHRSMLQRNMEVAMRHLAELEAQAGDPEAFERLGALMTDGDDDARDRLNEIYHKVIATPTRIDSHRKLVETLKHLIAVQRQAFGISDGYQGEPPAPPTGSDGRVALDFEAVRAAIEKRRAEADLVARLSGRAVTDSLFLGDDPPLLKHTEPGNTSQVKGAPNDR